MALQRIFKFWQILNKSQLKSSNFAVPKANFYYGEHHKQLRTSLYVPKERKVGVVLSGCGKLDGSEIYEAAAVTLALYNNVLYPVFYAPSSLINPINHITTQTSARELRYLGSEASRITGYNVFPLDHFKYKDVSGLIITGGNGVLKNLTNFYEKEKFDMHKKIIKALDLCWSSSYPVGVIGTAAVIAARIYCDALVTVGRRGGGEHNDWPYTEILERIAKLTPNLVEMEADQYTYEEGEELYSTPGYMYAGPEKKIFNGIQAMVNHMAHSIIVRYDLKNE